MPETFDTRVDFDTELPLIQPDRSIEFDPGFSGEWLVAGDLDGDGEAELLTARNLDQAVTAMSAYKLDGRLLWQLGRKRTVGSERTYDVPAQIYDIDGDGRCEVLYSIRGFLIVAEGNSGRELARLPLPEGLDVADCITFARLSGSGRASDIIVKTRYTRMWAFTMEWKLLWEWAPPEGWKTCHHPTPVDVDADGLDEVMAGYTMLAPDGRELWTYSSDRVDLAQGHLDCCCVVVEGAGGAEETRLAVTGCGADHLALLDGTGRMLWELTGDHFESVEVGRIRPEADWDLVVDADHRPFGKSPTWIVSATGEYVGCYETNYSRFHRLVDINGDGQQEIVLAHARAICDGRGHRLAAFAPDAEFERVAAPGAGDSGPYALVGDMTGNGAADIVVHTERKALVYENSHGPAEPGAEVGSGSNFTLY